MSCKDNNPVEQTVRFESFSNNVWVSIDGEQYDLNTGSTINFNPYGVVNVHVVCNKCSYAIKGVNYSGTRSFEAKMFR